MLKDVETLSCLLSPASSWHLTDKAHNELLSIFLARDQSAFTIRILLHSRPSVALHLFLKFRFLKIWLQLLILKGNGKIGSAFLLLLLFLLY